jgi:hypothetical protein
MRFYPCIGLGCLFLAVWLFGSAAGAADERLIEEMKVADPASGPVQLRPKFLTDGSYDAADPSAPIQVQLSHGGKAWMIIFSGGSVIYADSLDEFLRGGVHALHDIGFLYPDGTKVTTKPYRIKAAPWDPDLAFFHSDAGPQVVGYAGMMEKCKEGIEPTRATDNWTRTRHAFRVEVWRETHVGQIHQLWKDLGSVQGYRPCGQNENPWLSPSHAHGYGSHYIEDRDGRPFLFFDEVTEQKQVNGSLVPYRTEILFRQLDETRTRTIGPKEFALKATRSDDLHKPFKAARRSIGGLLIEGPHLIEANVGGVDYYIMFFSAGDAFTDRYGSYYAYRLKSEGVNGPFTAAVDNEGELINITQSLSSKIDATWGIGRPNPFSDEQGHLWIAGHLILKEEIPDNETKSGWPPTYEELVKRARRSLLIPITTELRDGRPLVKTIEGIR